MMNRMHFSEYRKKPFWVFRIIGWVILGIIGAAALAFILGFAVMYLWNWIMPDVFGLTQITFWQSFGIVLLARIIFGSFKHHHDKKPYSKSSSRKRPPYRCDDSDHYKKWKFFDKFWEDEGENAFQKYVENSNRDSIENSEK